jgi:excisionase family DNA binding protein
VSVGVPMPVNEREVSGSIPSLLTLLEVADRLRLSPHTIRSFVKKGRLSPVRLCRRLLFRAADVERFIAQYTGAGEAEL